LAMRMGMSLAARTARASRPAPVMAYVMSVSTSVVAGSSVLDRDHVALICALDLEGVVGLNDRRLYSDGGRQTLLMPPSKTMSEPIMNELSSEASRRR
jgi:hypothetical protein